MSDVDGQHEMLPGASVSNLGESDIVASLSAYARAFGTDRETLRRRLLEGGVEPMAERAGHKLYRLGEVFRAWALADSVIDPEKLSPFNRRAWYQAELDRLKLQENRRELIPRMEVEQELASVLKKVGEVFDTLPDIIERDAGATPAQLHRVEDVLDRAREDIYRRLAEAAREPPAPVEPSPALAQEPPRPVRARGAAAATGGALDAAGNYLLEALAAGARQAADLIAEAAARHISETSLRRAKAKLGVEARRAGKGWEWVLDQDGQGSQAG